MAVIRYYVVYSYRNLIETYNIMWISHGLNILFDHEDTYLRHKNEYKTVIIT